MLNSKPKHWVRGDLDGFFGLFIDNLLQFILIFSLCSAVLGFDTQLITGTILPGAAISILIGNLFYSWQARKLMQDQGREDVTAIPYGINTVSLFAFILLVMLPALFHAKGNGQSPEQAVQTAWKVGIFACFISGLIECAGALVGSWIRRNTPRAALLSPLAGIAITFISMGFVFQIFSQPIYALLPMFLLLLAYASKIRLPFGMPGGLVSIVIGTLLAWGLKAYDPKLFTPQKVDLALSFYIPGLHIGSLMEMFSSDYAKGYLAVIVPMGIINAVASLQNLESAAATGDDYPTGPSMLANGVGTLVAACLGSPFPTTIYIGHPAWKGMGARSGYSIANGFFVFILALIGGTTLAVHYIPMEVALGIMLWIGLVITAQSFEDIPKKHFLGLAFGLIPSFAAWALLIINSVLTPARFQLNAFHINLRNLWNFLPEGGLHIRGLVYLSQGFLLSSMIFAATMVWLVERKFLKAGVWMFVAALLSAIGLIHAFQMDAHGQIHNYFSNEGDWVAAGQFTLMYGLTGLMFIVMHLFAKKPSGLSRESA